MSTNDWRRKIEIFELLFKLWNFHFKRIKDFESLFKLQQICIQ